MSSGGAVGQAPANPAREALDLILEPEPERGLEERVASAPAGALAASLRRSSSSGGRQPPLGAICLGMHDDIKLNAFAKFRCARRARRLGRRAAASVGRLRCRSPAASHTNRSRPRSRSG